MFDSHFHLDFLPEAKLPELVADALSVGVQGGLSAGVWLETYDNCLGLAERHSAHLTIARRGLTPPESGTLAIQPHRFTVFLAHGLHPIAVAENWVRNDGTLDHERIQKDKIHFSEQLQKNEDTIWAIGETGLDLSPSVLHRPSGVLPKTAVLNAQQEAFSFCIEQARQYDLPLIIHSRNAWKACLDHTLAALERGVPRAMIHCYGGSVEEFAVLARHGIFASFGGAATWSRARRTHLAAAHCPPELLLLETDAPDQAPENEHGERKPECVPADLQLICSHISSGRQQPSRLLGELADENLRKFLGINYPSP